MKKVLAILAVFSALPLSFTFAAGSTSSSATYNGTVARQCLIQAQLTPSQLNFSDANGDGFADSVSSYSEFSYQSNTNCTINSAPAVVSVPDGFDRNGAEITQDCFFPGDTKTLIANNAFTQVGSSVTFTGNNRGKALLAGDYSVTCNITVSL